MSWDQLAAMTLGDVLAAAQGANDGEWYQLTGQCGSCGDVPVDGACACGGACGCRELHLPAAVIADRASYGHPFGCVAGCVRCAELDAATGPLWGGDAA